MWPHHDHSDEDYSKAIQFVEDYAVSLGAEYVCTNEEQFTTYVGDKIIKEKAEMKVFKYGDEYFRVEHHFLADRPFIVFSFGETIENIFEDANPFPYNLEEDELKAEVRYSLGIESYPKG